MSLSPALAQALADIAASGAARQSKQDRIDADSRIIFLRAVCVANSHYTIYDGMTGGMQMVLYVTSAASSRRARAGCLLRARRHQLNGYRAGVLNELARAAALRRTELVRRWAERSDAAFVSFKTALAELEAKPLVAA